MEILTGLPFTTKKKVSFIWVGLQKKGTLADIGISSQMRFSSSLSWQLAHPLTRLTPQLIMLLKEKKEDTRTSVLLSIPLMVPYSVINMLMPGFALKTSGMKKALTGGRTHIWLPQPTSNSA